ncbi:unnamed protein product [Urochloa decumbens]|uniref:Protein kinase domain-containing protein n=1 Tax=Urochloa decumbens TaxID=240449 RepID=A0ABC8YU20_9POAL
MALALRCRLPLPLSRRRRRRLLQHLHMTICQLQASSCGKVEIKYPFYLSNETAEVRRNSNSYCGYPGLAIDCNDGRDPMLRLDNGDYNVTDINYSSSTISLAYPDVIEDESCPRIHDNVTVPPALWLYFPGSTTMYLLFSNCSISSLAGQPKIEPLNCASSDGGGQYSFLIPSDMPHEALSRACKQAFLVPVLRSASQIDQTSPQWTIGGVLNLGFQLTWDITRRSSNCTKCDNFGGRCAYNRDGEFVGCLCTNGQVSDQDCTKGHQKRSRIYIIASALSSLLLLCLLILAFFLARNYGLLSSKRKEEPTIKSFMQNNGHLYTKRYTFAEVKRMTMSFSVKLGQGGFGDVYRGNLSDGRQVAVKMLKESKGDGEGFMNEVASISRTSHVNIVMLLGFCLHGYKRALIYEYMPNGSLERYAFNNNFKCENTLTWEKLFDITIGTARGLEYLHRGCNTRIVHFDIKPHNILLDQDFCPKISDFGLAKLCLNKESAFSVVGARGTIGYIAPEVYSKRFGTVSSKSDVYSYGMMVLEMVGARDKNINAGTESSSQYFPQWIYEHVDEYCLSASEINGDTTELVRKMIVVGLWCIQMIPTDRPTMTRVVEMLEGSTSNLELPPKVLLS